MDDTRPSRRRFLTLLPSTTVAAAGLLTGLLRPGRLGAAGPTVPGFRSPHPEPRPGVDASKVLPADQLTDAPDAVPVYDAVREIPHIADGLRCHCGCADLEGYRSLLSCFEEGGMAKWCEICQGEARLAHGRWKEGQSLDQIRRAIDARYGHGHHAVRPGSHGRHPAAHRSALLVTVLASAALALSSIPASAQIRASERGIVAQTVDGTTLTIDYGRPVARGRAGLFGEVVPWGEVWTPGANEATVLELSKDVTLEGRPVPAGRWSVWMATSEEGPWELVLDPRDTLFHTQHPELEEDQIRFPVEVLDGEHMEILTWSFPGIHSGGGTLDMRWGTTRVALAFEVEPSLPLTVDPADAAAHVGEWTVKMTMGPGDPTPFVVRYADDGTLRATTMFPGADGPEEMVMILQQVAPGIFRPGFMEDGELRESLPDTFIEFETEGDRSVRFALRGPKDQVWMTGERTPAG